MIKAEEEQESQKKQLNELSELKKDYLATFSKGEGKRVLADLERMCFINRTTYPADKQALTLAFNEGARFVVVHIKNMMNLDLKKIHELSQKRGE